MSEVGSELSCLDPEINVCLLEVCSDDENLVQWGGGGGGREGGRERRRGEGRREAGWKGGRKRGREGKREGGKEGGRERGKEEGGREGSTGREREISPWSPDVVFSSFQLFPNVPFDPQWVGYTCVLHDDIIFFIACLRGPSGTRTYIRLM